MRTPEEIIKDNIEFQINDNSTDESWKRVISQIQTEARARGRVNGLKEAIHIVKAEIQCWDYPPPLKAYIDSVNKQLESLLPAPTEKGKE
jgi:hypothetical protein